MRKKSLIFQTLLVLLMLLILSSVSEGINTLLQKAEIKPIKGNPQAPLFTLEDLDGKKVDFKQFRDRVVFLNFWATWCGPCKEEMPSMEILYQKFKDQKFVFLAVSVDYEEKKKVKEFISKHRYTFPILVDPKGITLDLYGIKGIPTTILIDKKGRMIGRAIGHRVWNHPNIEDILNEMLKI